LYDDAWKQAEQSARQAKQAGYYRASRVALKKIKESEFSLRGNVGWREHIRAFQLCTNFVEEFLVEQCVSVDNVEI